MSLNSVPDVTIIGAGPVGCLMACFLTRLGITCIMYEKRQDPRIVKDTGKSINLALSTRGFTALSACNENYREILPCIKLSVPMHGRVIHLINGEMVYQPYSDDPKEYLHSINRAKLNNDLMNFAQSNGVKIIFGHTAEFVKFNEKLVIIKNTINGNTISVKYNTLWGMDGSNSCIRGEVERINGISEKVVAVTKFRAGYKEFEIIAKDGKPQISPVEAFHVWPRDGGNFFIALPNADNTFTCTLFSTIDSPECIDKLNEHQIVDYFKKEFPDVAKIMGNEKIVNDHKVNPFSGLYSINMEKWHFKGDVVVMGDAAHGIVPYYGLGINGGFEGCRHMYNIIQKYTINKKPNWEKIFSVFNNYKKHSDVLRILSMKNADELHVHVSDTHFLFEKTVERELQKKYPTQFIEAHSLLSFTNVPLDVCGKQIQYQKDIITEICKGKKEINEIDWNLAHKLIQAKLSNLNNQKLWYENGDSKL